MKYRNIAELTNKEIAEIVEFTIQPDRIINIVRHSKTHTVEVEVDTSWTIGGVTQGIRDTVYFVEPGFALSDNGMVCCDWEIKANILWKYEQYCIAHGCHKLWYRNPYIKEV